MLERNIVFELIFVYITIALLNERSYYNIQKQVISPNLYANLNQTHLNLILIYFCNISYHCYQFSTFDVCRTLMGWVLFKVL